MNSFNITAPPKTLSLEEKALEAAKTSLVAYGKLCLKDFHKSETPQFHYTLSKAYLNKDIQYLAVFVQRGAAKTTYSKAFILHQLCHRKPDEQPHFIGWVADNQKRARRNLENVKKNIISNPRIKRYYNIHPSPNKWAAEEAQLLEGDYIMSKSNASSLRGENIETIEFGSIRYSIILFDDIENEENTKSENLREDIRNSVYNGALPARDTGRNFKIIMNATPVHWDSMCYRIIQKADEAEKANEKYFWHVIYLPATQPDMPGGVLWHSRFPKEELDRIKQTYLDDGRLSGYYQEYELVPQGNETRIWTKDHYKYHDTVYVWNEKEQQSYLNDHGILFPVNCFLGCDPATDINTVRADFSSILVIAVAADMRIFVLDYVAQKGLKEISLKDENGEILGNKGVVDYIFGLYEMYHCKHATVEDVGITRGIWQQAEAEMMRLKKRINLEPIRPGGKEKLNKIKTGLDVHFSYRRIHIRKAHDDLAFQIENMGPLIKHDDIIESLYFAVQNIYVPDKKENIVKRLKHAIREPDWWLTH